MATLTGGGRPIDLGQGYAVRAPGIRGEAMLQDRAADASRAARSAEAGTAALDEALAATKTTEVRQIELRIQPTVGRPAEQPLRSAGDDREMLELEVPHAGPEYGQLVLACDESGVLTWHLPVDGTSAAAGASRGGGPTRTFLIPASPIASPTAARSETRSLIGAVGRKLLKVLVYPMTDPIVGAISDFFAERWEARNRPYGLRTMSPDDFREKGAGALGMADWSRLTSDPALLVLHGTFSTAHGALAGLSDAAFQQLHANYGGRVLALNHFTLAHDPKQNVEWLLSQLPGDARLDVDVLCHSRGGLVARTLAERPSAFGLDTSKVAVKRVVFVGVPNQGTVLADPDHLVKMLDRLTSALNLFPSGPVTEVLEGIITAVKMIGHGALKGLRGLAAMQPEGPFLKTLNTSRPANVEYFGVAADYEPTQQGLKALVSGTVKDAVMDRVFQQVANDLVVPEPGVYGDNGSGAFPIPADHLLRLGQSEGVVHTAMFGHPKTAARLPEWLTGRSACCHPRSRRL